MKKHACSILLTISFVLLSLNSTSCTTVRVPLVSKEWLQHSLQALERNCKLIPSSGFAADLGIMNQGGARIEAIWDQQGHLDGQILNAIGEDVLAFNIDNSGFLRLDKNISKSETIIQALDFIAHLGAQETRSLLCSGLFITSQNNSFQTKISDTNEKEFLAEKAGMQWFAESKISAVPEQPRQVLVETKVSSKKFLFRKTVAEIIWLGEQKANKIIPTSLTISADKIDIKLSFLDFE